MAPQAPFLLGIESSCDDTGCAIVDASGAVLASPVSSQLTSHRPYGGVVPEIASREHLRNWPAVSQEALATAGIALNEISAVAATRGPGLTGSLLVGLSVGRAMAWGLDRPFYGVHHLEGHIYSPFLREQGPADPVPDRLTALVVSGGHTSLLDVSDGVITSMAETRDDAFGEAFDKVGKRLGLAYPQGPKVDLLAERGDAERLRFTVRGRDELFFSYSGLKTQAVRALEALEAAGAVPAHASCNDLDAVPAAVCDLAATFRDAAVRQILDRLDRLAARQPLTTLAVSGGAAANRLLRRRLVTWAERRQIVLRLVPLVFSGDNAAMIAFAASRRMERGDPGDGPDDATVLSRMPFAPAKPWPAEAHSTRDG